MRVPTWQRDGHIVLGKRRGTIEPVDRALTRELEHELSALASQHDPADAFGGVAGFVEPPAIVPFDRVGSRAPFPAPLEPDHVEPPACATAAAPLRPHLALKTGLDLPHGQNGKA